MRRMHNGHKSFHLQWRKMLAGKHSMQMARTFRITGLILAILFLAALTILAGMTSN